MEKVDVTIIGGGVVGLTLACLLANKELTIALIDTQPPPDAGLKLPYEHRVSAINLASQKIFNSVNVWSSMKQLRISAYQHMRVWDANSPAQLTFDCSEVNQTCLGYIVEQSVMRQTLWQQLQTYPNVETYFASEPSLLQETEKQVTVQLKDGRKIKTNLLVGADGRSSWVAEKTSLTNTDETTTTAAAIVATLRTEYAHQHTALQRFLHLGPVALLPLADPHLVSLVWSTTASAAQYLATMPQDSFNAKLTQATEKTLGNLNVCDERAVFPLYSYQVKHYVKPRIALLGDAAHTILPLAGQGLNLGLLDAVCLAQIIAWALENKRDIGALATLRRYELWRKGENTAMKKAMEGFHNCFSSTTEFARHARHWGFALTQKIPAVKKYFMRRAIGLHANLPKAL